MSVASLVHGCKGISCPSTRWDSRLHLAFEYFKHSSQLRTKFSICSFSPGQYTDSFAWSLHLFKPKCPSWISSRMAFLFWFGMAILVPFRMRPSSMISSLQNVQNGHRAGGICFMDLGQPSIMVCLRMASSSSSCVANLSCCKLLLLAGNC